jgi:threonine/homoserine/homoserine lactone efflux protein
MIEVWHAILKGIVAGLLIAVMIGPVFFALLQTSIKKGLVAGILFAVGIVLSDSLYFLLAFFGLSQLGGSFDIKKVMGIGGGIFLLGFGLMLLFKKKPPKEKGLKDTDRYSLWKSFAQGFLINMLNPSALLYWASVVTFVNHDYEGDERMIFSFFLACMSVVFGTDALKAFLAFRLRDWVTEKFMLWLNRISGTVLAGAGGKLLFDVVKAYI